MGVREGGRQGEAGSGCVGVYGSWGVGGRAFGEEGAGGGRACGGLVAPSTFREAGGWRALLDAKVLAPRRTRDVVQGRIAASPDSGSTRRLELEGLLRFVPDTAAVCLSEVHSWLLKAK